MLEPELRMHRCPKSSPRAVLLRGGPDQAGLGAPVNYRARCAFVFPYKEIDILPPSELA